MSRWGVFLFLLVSVCLVELASGTLAPTNRQRRAKILSRRRRYVTFPEGSSFSMAACLTVGIIGQPIAGLYTWGMNWGIAFELPNETQALKALRKFRIVPRPVMQRRHRRDLYEKLELAMNSMGYDGRQCVFRALCESAQMLSPKAASMVEELFRVAFTMPENPVLPSEPAENHFYDAAHKIGKTSSTECSQFYRRCPFSLVDLALGLHDAPNLDTGPPILTPSDMGLLGFNAY